MIKLCSRSDWICIPCQRANDQAAVETVEYFWKLESKWSNCCRCASWLLTKDENMWSTSRLAFIYNIRDITSGSWVGIEPCILISGRVTESESLFTYPKGKTFYSTAVIDYSFTPSYVDASDPALKAISTQVDALCGLSLDCRYLLQKKRDNGESLNDTTTGALRLIRGALEEGGYDIRYLPWNSFM